MGKFDSYHRFPLSLDPSPDDGDWEERKAPQGEPAQRLCQKLLFRAPGNPGDVRLDNVIDRYFPMSTGLTLVLNAFASPSFKVVWEPNALLFNPSVLEQHAGVARAGRNFNSHR